jgi:hypothetical protein
VVKDQFLLKWLRITAVIDGQDIYQLDKKRSNLLEVHHNNPKLVISDGYHITKPLELVYHHLHTYYFKVECGINDYQLFYGVFIMAILFPIGYFTQLLAIQIASALPVLYFLYLYYINRKNFIVLRPS